MAEQKTQKIKPMIMHWTIPIGIIIGAIVSQGGIH